jgi:hypothetical protein
MDKKLVTWNEFYEMIEKFTTKLRAARGPITRIRIGYYSSHLRLYPVPKGGLPIVQAIASVSPVLIVDNPGEADYIVDDVVDSYADRIAYKTKYPNTIFVALVERQAIEEEMPHLVWPWEQLNDGVKKWKK